MLLLKDYNGIDYLIPTTEQIVHKLMRSYLYFSVSKYNISNFKNEVGVNIKDLKIIFDASFEINNQLYFVEVHNEQNISKLRERLNQCLTLANNIKFNLIIYCKNKDSVNNLLQKMNSNGFDSYVNFNLFIFNFKEEIIL
jgi:superfamily II DNA/RNA helicase